MEDRGPEAWGRPASSSQSWDYPAWWLWWIVFCGLAPVVAVVFAAATGQVELGYAAVLFFFGTPFYYGVALLALSNLANKRPTAVVSSTSGPGTRVVAWLQRNGSKAGAGCIVWALASSTGFAFIGSLLAGKAVPAVVMGVLFAAFVSIGGALLWGWSRSRQTAPDPQMYLPRDDRDLGYAAWGQQGAAPAQGGFSTDFPDSDEASYLPRAAGPRPNEFGSDDGFVVQGRGRQQNSGYRLAAALIVVLGMGGAALLALLVVMRAFKGSHGTGVTSSKVILVVALVAVVVIAVGLIVQALSRLGFIGQGGSTSRAAGGAIALSMLAFIGGVVLIFSFEWVSVLLSRNWGNRAKGLFTLVYIVFLSLMVRGFSIYWRRFKSRRTEDYDYFQQRGPEFFRDGR